jgi:hypothetical protein
MVFIEVNWKDNPWWNKTLDAERLHDKEHFPDTYENIWEGQTAVSGSYYGNACMVTMATVPMGTMAIGGTVTMGVRTSAVGIVISVV